MKKILLLFFLVCSVLCSSAQEHLSFKGIPIEGTMYSSETLNEGANTVEDILSKQFCDESRTRRDRYRELSKGLFTESSYGELEQLPLFQIWRDHMLAVSMCKAFPEKYDEGLFLFLAPYSNEECRKGVAEYKSMLLKKESCLDSHFCYAWLEEYIETLDKVFDAEWTKNMKSRYVQIRDVKPLII